jgi:hypothetical protein
MHDDRCQLVELFAPRLGVDGRDLLAVQLHRVALLQARERVVEREWLDVREPALQLRACQVLIASSWERNSSTMISRSTW